MEKLLPWLLVILLLLSGCGVLPSQGTLPASPPSSEASASSEPEATLPEAESGGPIFLLTNGDHTTVVDAAGRALFRTREPICLLVFDTFTGEARYIQTERVESSPEPEDPWAFDGGLYSLYRLDGTPLRENSATTVVNAWDDLAVSYSREDQTMYLENLRTGEVLLKGFDAVDLAEDGLILSDRTQGVYTRIDRSGQVLDQVQGQYSLFYSLMVGDRTYFVVCREEGGAYGLLNARLEPVLDFAYSAIDSCGNYLILRQEKPFFRCQVLDPDTGEILMESQDNIRFFNGTQAILQDQNWWEGKSRLTDPQGNPLSRDYDSLFTLSDFFFGNSGSQETARVFLAMDEAGQECLLDGTGRVIYDAPQDSAFFSWLDDRYLALIQDRGVVLLDGQGNSVFSRDKYQYLTAIQAPEDLSPEAPRYYLASFTTSQGLSLYDLLDEAGNVVLANLKDPGQMQGDLLVCTKGFSTGLMDLEGHWRYRESIFDSMTLD